MMSFRVEPVLNYITIFNLKYFVVKEAYLKWTSNWTTFLDAMLQMIGSKENIFRMPQRIASLAINPQNHLKHNVDDG